jgi:hypothetical protein
VIKKKAWTITMVHGVGFIVGMDIRENDIVRVSWMDKENVRVGDNDGFCYDVGMIQCS